MGINGLISNIGVPSIMSTPTNSIEIKQYHDIAKYNIMLYNIRINGLRIKKQQNICVPESLNINI